MANPSLSEYLSQSQRGLYQSVFGPEYLQKQSYFTVDSATGVGAISYQWQSKTFATDFENVPVSATTQVYTPTSAKSTTTFFRRAAISTFGGKQCEEYSNVVEVKSLFLSSKLI